MELNYDEIAFFLENIEKKCHVPDGFQFTLKFGHPYDSIKIKIKVKRSLNRKIMRCSKCEYVDDCAMQCLIEEYADNDEYCDD